MLFKEELIFEFEKISNKKELFIKLASEYE